MMTRHIVWMLFATSLASAQMVPVTRHSRVYAWERIIDLSGHDQGLVTAEQTTSSFAPFDWSIQAGGYTAIQHSSIGAGLVTVDARTFGTAISMGYGNAESSMTFVFNIVATSTYRLEGSVASFIGQAKVVFSGPNILISHEATSMAPTPFVYEGFLQPGQYELSVLGTADYSVANATLAVIPAPPSAALACIVCGLAPRRRRRVERTLPLR